MSTWMDLLFGNLVGFSAVLVLGSVVLIAVFFIVSYLRLTRIDPGKSGSDGSSPSD
ncbi:MAG: hypothetical protein KJO54_08485 [Gammaproteobacteria bacterium]|nr:hypothetical protein [Gammaproteobacteria bacterium]